MANLLSVQPLAERSQEPLPRRHSLRALVLASQREHVERYEEKRPNGDRERGCAFGEAAKGIGRSFVDMSADNVEWSIIGSTEWSRTFRGKRSLILDLLRPLAEQIDGPNTVEATCFIAEGNLIVEKGPKPQRDEARPDLPTAIAGYSRCGAGKLFASQNIATRSSSSVFRFTHESERPPSGLRDSFGQAIVGFVTHFQVSRI